MERWTNALVDSKPIEIIFNKDVPPLAAVDLHELVIDRDGPTAILRFDLSAYPSVPPKKWDLQQYNRVQVRLMLIGISYIKLEGWTTNCTIDLQLTKMGNKVTLATTSGTTKILIEADFAEIQTVSAYRE